MRQAVAEPSTISVLHLPATFAAAREAQQRWAAVPLHERLRVLRRFRHGIAADPERLARTVPTSVSGSLHRHVADTLAAEVLPLADACRFLEREAPRVLDAQRLSRSGRPFFHRHVDAMVERVPLGVIAILGPANYPLFLPGVQAMQALAAGNAVLWKPAETGVECAREVERMLTRAGLPPDLLTVLDPSVETARAALDAGVDKVVLTGHVATGRAVLGQLAETLTPAVMELSGCDAVFVLPGADIEHVAEAVTFSLRLNGSATCMAPRRLFVAKSELAPLRQALLPRLATIDPVPLSTSAARDLTAILQDAQRAGAVVHRSAPESAHSLAAILIEKAQPEMLAMQSDIIAPLLSMITFDSTDQARIAHRMCPYALTASVFGPEREARALASQLEVGTVLINDCVVPTADPRLPFGGRRQSGYGVTRGAEGLLEFTAIRTLVVQKRADRRAYQATGEEHVPFFSSYIAAAHAATWRDRLHALRRFVAAARRVQRAGQEISHQESDR